jgi:hypothetical protein
VGFVVDKLILGQVFPEYFGFLLSVSFHWCIITRKKCKNIVILIIGLQNKPQGGRASVASAAGSFTTKEVKDVEDRLLSNYTALHLKQRIKLLHICSQLVCVCKDRSLKRLMMEVRITDKKQECRYG